MFVSNFPPNNAFFTIGMQKNACLTHPHPTTLQEDAAARELRSALLLSEAHVAPHLPQEQRRWSERFRDSRVCRLVGGALFGFVMGYMGCSENGSNN